MSNKAKYTGQQIYSKNGDKYIFTFYGATKIIVVNKLHDRFIMEQRLTKAGFRSYVNLLLNQGFTLEYDDRITSISGARLKVAPIRTWRSISFLKV